MGSWLHEWSGEIHKIKTEACSACACLEVGTSPLLVEQHLEACAPGFCMAPLNLNHRLWVHVDNPLTENEHQ
jgi:hypothetical protein